VVASPHYLRRRGRPRRPEQIAGHDVVLFSALNAPPEWRFERGGQVTRVRLAPRFITNSADAAIAHAIEDGGLTRTLAYQVVDALRAGSLEIVLADYETSPVPISAVYPSSRLLSAKVRSFVDLAAREAHWHFVELNAAVPRRAVAPPTP
jgi:DNA-binding transcriptional LysR family regulator